MKVIKNERNFNFSRYQLIECAFDVYKPENKRISGGLLRMTKPDKEYYTDEQLKRIAIAYLDFQHELRKIKGEITDKLITDSLNEMKDDKTRTT